MERDSAATRVIALAGGVGGAKLAHGIALARPDERLAVVVNTADDFSLFGLHISPDLDTVMYTLAGIANPETGWGIAGDSFVTLDMIRAYDRDAWFWLGDKDFGTHILRSERLRSGVTLSDVTVELAGALGIAARILPMCDESVATLIETADGLLEFQEYFVRRGHDDDVLGIQFRGVETATVPEPVAKALGQADVMILCPSNPFVSVGPILALPGLREHLRQLTMPIVAVSPIVGGQALKGPAGQMLANLGHEVSPVGVAALYQDFLTGMVIDEQDAGLSERISDLGIAVHVTDTIMHTEEDRARLAEETLVFAESLAGERALR